MKKRHIGICTLLSCVLLQGYALAIAPDPMRPQVESRGARIDQILSNVKRVFEGLIKVIKDPHNKPNVLLHVGDMLSGIFSIAAHSLPNHELSQDEVAELRSLLQDVAQSLVPLLQHDLTESAASLREYLQTVPLESLNQVTDQDSSMDIPYEPSVDDNEEELHTSLLNALHNLIQNLFAIVQYPEDTRVMEQSIADMFSSIINVASKTLKYEYLSSKDAEETVVSYLDSFSDELTKEIKHLMLQTALHLRGSRGCGSCNNCCSNSCSSGCYTTICKPCCKPYNTCCRNIDTESQIKGCCSCSSCNCSLSNSSGCNCCASCNSSQKSTDSEVNRKCSSCGCATNSCTCKKGIESSSRKCSTCGCTTNSYNNCNSCGGKTVAIDSQNPTFRACSSCGNGSSNSCHNCNCKNTMRQQISLRKCSSCSCSNNNSTCNTCNCKTIPMKTRIKYTKSGNNYAEFSTEDYLKCGCNKPKPQQDITRNDNICSKCGCSNKPNRPGQESRCGCGKPKPQQSTNRDLKCGCSKPKPQQEITRDVKCNCNKPRPQQVTRNENICSKCGCFNKPNRPGQEARCGCSKPKPQQEITRNENVCSKCGCFNKPNRPGQEARCGCGKPKPQQEITRNENICSKCGCFNKPNRPGQEARCGCSKPKPQPQ